MPTWVDVLLVGTLLGDHDGGSHSDVGHLWRVCLAVLAAGLAVLLMLFGALRLGVAPAAVAQVHATLGSPPQPRPPDLHALCLLRT